MCGTTAVLAGGAILEQGPTDQVLENPASRDAVELVQASAGMCLPLAVPAAAP